MGHTTYAPSNEEELWMNYFMKQAEQSGHGLDAFQGLPYQRGYGLGSFFGRLFRSILPIMKSAGKSVGKEALSMGANVLGDVVRGKDLGQAAKEHGRKAAANLMDKASNQLRTKQSGGRLNRQSVGGKTIPVAKQKQQQKKKKKTPKKNQGGRSTKRSKKDIFNENYQAVRSRFDNAP